MGIELRELPTEDRVTVNYFAGTDGEPLSIPFEPVKLITGDKNNYRINYGNGLVEMGGIVQIECSVVTTGVVEGTHVVELPFSNLLHFDAVAMNVVDSPDSITGEDAFVTDVTNGFKIYATAKATSTHTIPVKWIAKGVM